MTSLFFERFEAEECLQFECMVPPCLCAMPVLAPAFYRHFELSCDGLQQWEERLFSVSERHAKITHGAKLYGVAKPVPGSPVLPDDCQMFG